jgi:putative transposase
LPVFFTVCLAQRASTALIDHLAILRGAVRATLVDRPFDILAWVVLPDHMHAIWRLPPDDPDYGQRWARIKARFSRDACRAGLVAPGRVPGTKPRKGELGIWQPRFWEHHCRNAQDLDRHLRYCWLNPVRHGYVDQPTDWAASSIHRDIRLGRLAPDWHGADVAGRFGEAEAEPEAA